MVLLSSRWEVEPTRLTERGHPIVFTHKLKKAYERVRDRGAAAGPLHEEGGMGLFEITDPEGNVIDV